MSATIKLRGILVITALLFSSFVCSEAVVPVLTQYTRPTGLQSVDGSDPFGGCPRTPQNCVVTSGGADICQCPGSTPATGVLIDGVIPTIDFSDMNWSSRLFTVNRNGQSTIVIGFSFASTFVLRGVEIKLFNCPARNIAAPTINVYESIVFPAFIPSLSTVTLIGSTDTLDNQNCMSLTTVTIPVQLTTSARSAYFIEVTFTNDPDIEWVRIAEIEFSDETPTQPPTTETTTTMSSTTSSSTTAVETTESSNTIETGTMTSTVSPITNNPNPTTVNTIASTMTSTVSPNTEPTTVNTIVSTMTSTIAGATTITETPTSMIDPSVSSASQTSTIIGVLVAIIGVLLMLLIIGVIAVLAYVVFHNKNKRGVEIHQLQDATLELPQEPIRYSMIRETDTAVNQHYEDLEKSGYATIPYSKTDDELYSVVRDERTGSRDGLDSVGNEVYNDIDAEHTMTHQTTPSKLETVALTSEDTTKKLPDYAHVNKPPNPPIPPKTPDLYRELKTEKEDGWREATDPPLIVVNEYADVDGDVTEKEYYSEIKSDNTLTKSHSGPVVLTKSLCNEMDENPDYESSGSALMLAGMANGIGGNEDIYTDPDARFSQEMIHDIIYSEPIQPSLFDLKEPEQEDECEDIQPYAPIYTLAQAPAPDDIPPLNVTEDNIQPIQDLGTGFFGNVVLAQTVGLSRKDLRLSDSDDDKSVTIKVAVKMLKRNTSEKRRKAFEKEHLFMARLNHPNVIRMLGVCTEDVPFIMMEYMEKGDLNQYLQKFTSISNDSVHSESEIQMSTLVYMATQIASAMKYLTSKNYIHRDIATRNCLVGENFLVKLGDFGMSRNLYESHYYIIRGHAILPVRWMASECFYGKFSAKTDVWAFGVTMWEIFTLAKEKPYSEMDDREVAQDAIKKHKRTLLEKPSDCPQEVYTIMLECWASDPKERATFEELHEALTSLNFSYTDDDCSV